jgi:alanine-glyoxylate transaminase/(R)-3-amino-2-methylpropionate-pyruvate transaminase
VNDALKQQIDKLWHTTSIYVTEPMQRYASKLIATLPPSLNVCYFVNSGTEANDLALLMARAHKCWHTRTVTVHLL